MFTTFRSDLKLKAKDLRKNMTLAEKKLWYEFLKNLPENFLRQKPIGNYIVDFYCSKKQLVIELDGESHFVEKIVFSDKERTEFLTQKCGLKVIRFLNDDVFKESSFVKGGF